MPHCSGCWRGCWGHWDDCWHAKSHCHDCWHGYWGCWMPGHVVMVIGVAGMPGHIVTVPGIFNVVAGMVAGMPGHVVMVVGTAKCPQGFPSLCPEMYTLSPSTRVANRWRCRWHRSCTVPPTFLLSALQCPRSHQQPAWHIQVALPMPPQLHSAGTSPMPLGARAGVLSAATSPLPSATSPLPSAALPLPSAAALPLPERPRHALQVPVHSLAWAHARTPAEAQAQVSEPGLALARAGQAQAQALACAGAQPQAQPQAQAQAQAMLVAPHPMAAPGPLLALARSFGAPTSATDDALPASIGGTARMGQAAAAAAAVPVSEEVQGSSPGEGDARSVTDGAAGGERQAAATSRRRAALLLEQQPPRQRFGQQQRPLLRHQQKQLRQRQQQQQHSGQQQQQPLLGYTRESARPPPAECLEEAFKGAPDGSIDRASLDRVDRVSSPFELISLRAAENSSPGPLFWGAPLQGDELAPHQPRGGMPLQGNAPQHGAELTLHQPQAPPLPDDVPWQASAPVAPTTAPVVPTTAPVVPTTAGLSTQGGPLRPLVATPRARRASHLLPLMVGSSWLVAMLWCVACARHTSSMCCHCWSVPRGECI